MAHHAYKRVWYVGPDAVHDTTVTASGEKIRVTGRRLEAQEIRDDVLTALRKQDKTAWSTTEPKARPEGAYTGPVQHISPPVAHDAVGTTYTTVSVGYVQYQGAQNPHNEQVNIDGYQQFMLGCVPGEILGLPEPVCSYLVGMEPNWWAPANGWTPPAAGPQTGYVATVYSAYTQDLANGVILGNATSGGTFAIDLLDATTAVGKQVQIKNTGTANNIVLTAVSGQTIDSASTASLGPGEACTIFSDGSAALWRCLSVPAASELPAVVGIGTPPSPSWILQQWTLAAAFRLVTAARDVNEAITTASVVWPDGATGTFTTDTASTAFPGAIDAYHITYVYNPGSGNVTRTITQAAVTRDSNGAVTAQPALTVV